MRDIDEHRCCLRLVQVLLPTGLSQEFLHTPKGVPPGHSPCLGQDRDIAGTQEDDVTGRNESLWHLLLSDRYATL